MGFLPSTNIHKISSTYVLNIEANTMFSWMSYTSSKPNRGKQTSKNTKQESRVMIFLGQALQDISRTSNMARNAGDQELKKHLTVWNPATIVGFLETYWEVVHLERRLSKAQANTSHVCTFFQDPIWDMLPASIWCDWIWNGYGNRCCLVLHQMKKLSHTPHG